MKNRKTHRNLAAAAAVVSCMSLASTAFAQQADSSQEKVHLMVQAITASENGDFVKAKSAYENLLKLSPNDKRVQELLADVNAKLEAIAKAEAEAKAAAEAEAKAKADAEAKAAAEAEAVAKAADDAKAAEAKAEADLAKAAEDAAKPSPEEELLLIAQHKQELSVESAKDLIKQALDKQDNGRYDEALVLLEQAEEKLEGNTSKNAEKVQASIKEVRADIAYERADNAIDANDLKAAKSFSDEYTKYEENTKKSAKLAKKIAKLDEDPYNHTMKDVSPEYAVRQKKVKALLHKGQIQYLLGDFEGAKATYQSVETVDPTNVEAKGYLYCISKKLGEIAAVSYKATREDMLKDVDNAWTRARQFTGTNQRENAADQVSPVQVKLSNIKIPVANFPGVALEEALNSLMDLSREADTDTKGSKGVNIIARGVSDIQNVTLRVNDLTLGQVLNFLVKQAGCQYDIEDGAIIVTKATETATHETYDFPISNATVTRMIGLQGGGSSSGGDLFGGDEGGEAAPDQSEQKIKEFLIKAGVEFGPGSSLAYDGTKLWVTNTTRNIDKVRNILQRYNEVQQVEIEAKFMEVNQGKLDELGFNWSVYNQNNGNVLFSTMNRHSTINDAGERVWTTTGGNNRTLGSFSTAGTASPIRISRTPTLYETPGGGLGILAGGSEDVNRNIPALPATMNFAENAVSTASTVLGVIDGYSIDLMVSAIQQAQGSDILCAPKVSVVSGSKATITVAQEMLYPASWGDMQSNVSQSSGNNGWGGGGGQASATITPGTPQDFTKRNVGVTMDVTPRVEEDGSISLELAPEVTEFEGFMEYGGVAIAIAGDTTVTVPSGFIQPVFSVRSVNTTVTVFDGATVVLGGLTREEVKTINDQVPILGDIPGIGRIFQSKGESRQKKNLLIFVTANRISPGGSLTRESVGGVTPGSVFSSPTVVTPAGSLNRTTVEEVEEEK